MQEIVSICNKTLCKLTLEDWKTLGHNVSMRYSLGAALAQPVVCDHCLENAELAV